MNKQITKIALMLVLAIGFAAGAAKAQEISDGGFAPAGIYDGVETAQGTCEMTFGMCYGNTFVLNSSGEWDSYHLTVSLNYLNIPNHNVNGGVSVVGGTWSLLVFNRSGYAGTLYGEVSEGEIVLVENDFGEKISRRVQVNLRSSGGLGIFKGKEGENIRGEYSATTDLRLNETRARANFTF